MPLFLINTLNRYYSLSDICGACNCISCECNDLDSNVPSKIISFCQNDTSFSETVNDYIYDYLHFLIKVLKLIFNTQILPLITMYMNLLLKTMCMTLLVLP